MNLTLTGLGSSLRRLREASGQSQAVAAAAARLARSRLTALETGAASNIELSTLLRLLDVYGMELHINPRTPRKSLNRVMEEAARHNAKERGP